VATKEHKRLAKGLVEQLESRVHVGPPVRHAEILSARQFLVRSDFSPASDYFSRLANVAERVQARGKDPASDSTQGKRNYGGEAGGYWLQVQSAFDHVIVSTCYQGEFNLRRGRVKVSHRFNQEGRVDFVELKLLRSLDPALNGALRKLLTVCEFPGLKRDWAAAEAFVLPVLPQELVFLYQDVFRCRREELFSWLINIGHRLVTGVLSDLTARPSSPVGGETLNGTQLPLETVRLDRVAMPVLTKAALLEASVELGDPKTVLVRYRSN
jgi:hypothetical protein